MSITSILDKYITYHNQHRNHYLTIEDGDYSLAYTQCVGYLISLDDEDNTDECIFTDDELDVIDSNETTYVSDEVEISWV